MNYKRVIEEMAKIEGVKNLCLRHDYYCGDIGIHSDVSCNYDCQHGDVQRVINCLNDDELEDYDTYLLKMYIMNPINMHKATTQEKCEAILKARGVWR